MADVPWGRAEIACSEGSIRNDQWRGYTQRSRWPQPNTHAEPRFGAKAAPRGRNQPSGTAQCWQSSKQVFQHGGAGRMHGGHGEGQYGASRGVRSGLARSAKFLLLRVLARPPCSSVLKNLLPYLGPAARTRHRWIAAGQREDGCISRGDARRAGPGGSPRKSMWYRRISGKSPQPAGIFKVSSAEEVHRTLPGRKSP